MRTPQAILFVDGENLTIRYQAMLEEGRRPQSRIVHEPDWFLWVDSLTRWAEIQFIRVLYYTSIVGDDLAFEAAKNRIAGTTYRCAVGTQSYEAQLVPRLFKKVTRERRSRHVDINITVDIMDYASSEAVNTIVLASGDGDFLPVLESAMRMGKNVYVLALSSGCHPSLQTSVDRFIHVDSWFFKP